MGHTPPKVQLILASSSPQRRRLLTQAGIPFQAIDPPGLEPDGQPADLPFPKHAEALAYVKAESVAQMHPDAAVLGADTIVAAGGDLLGKPADSDHARAMLQKLSGTQHEVITGVALIGPGDRRIIASETTRVTMRKMTPEQVEEYIRSGEWIRKAGAYAIQLTADRYVEKLEGSFTNVVGLPMELVTKILAEAGLWRTPDPC